MGSTYSLLAGLVSIVLPGRASLSSNIYQQEYVAAGSVNQNSTCQVGPSFLVLFGSNSHPWNIEKWQQVSDTVRGGSSYAKIDYIDWSNRSAGISFEGSLDTKTLGGAGFASQVYRHTLSIPQRYSSFFLEVEPIQLLHDHLLRKFTFGVKNDPPVDQNSSLTYQFDFQVPLVSSTTTPNQDSKWEELVKINIPFHALVPTFRGRPKPDEKPFDPGNIAEISIMCRSFFDNQSGQFHLNILRLGLQ